MTLAQTDSTMAEAARRIDPAAGPVWIMALAQTQARGRRGRVWHSPQGNFAASLIAYPDAPPAARALRSFVAALALRQALDDAAGVGGEIGLKWPNDLLFGGRKIAGILLENQSQMQGGALILGIGVNLAHAPSRDEIEEGALPATSLLAETGISLAPETLLHHLAPRYAALEQRLVVEGFAPIRAEWLSHACRLGQVITARMGQTAKTGRFADIDLAGNLILETDAGREAISAADIHF